MNLYNAAPEYQCKILIPFSILYRSNQLIICKNSIYIYVGRGGRKLIALSYLGNSIFSLKTSLQSLISAFVTY